MSSKNEGPRAKSESTSSSGAICARGSDGKLIAFIVGRRIGKGAFGQIRLGHNEADSTLVAIKLEARLSKFRQLGLEEKCYRELSSADADGIPKVYHYGNWGRYTALVMELLGPNLEELFNRCNRTFTIKTVCMIVLQILERLEAFHKIGYIYRDIKPENFLIGRYANVNKIYMVDYGLAKKYISSNGTHISFRDDKNLTGTARYMSIGTHKGYEQSRRDDLESVGHMVLYFLRSSLPWQGLQATEEASKYELIGKVKMETPVSQLCHNQPVEFKKFLEYSRKMEFTQDPDYDYLKNMFQGLMRANGWPLNYDNYDWSGFLVNSAHGAKSESKTAVAANLAPQRRSDLEHEDSQDKLRPDPKNRKNSNLASRIFSSMRVHRHSSKNPSNYGLEMEIAEKQDMRETTDHGTNNLFLKEFSGVADMRNKESVKVSANSKKPNKSTRKKKAAALQTPDVVVQGANNAQSETSPKMAKKSSKSGA